MKNFHTSQKLLLCLTVLILFSCLEDFLDQSPQGSVYEDNLKNAESLEDLLIGAYTALDGVTGGNFVWYKTNGEYSAGSNWLYGDVYADDAHKGATSSDRPDMDEIASHRQIAAMDAYNQKWKAVYNGIAKSNDVIYLTNETRKEGLIEDSLAIQITSEARFLRGYFHLEAIKMWDFIPYINETDKLNLVLVPNYPSTYLENNAGNTSWKDLGGDGNIPWKEVEEDFQFAVSHLPDLPRGGDPGHATRYAALGLLAKTCLFQGKYGEALPLLNEIMEGNNYCLANSFHDNFMISGNNNCESIFDIQSSVNDTGLGVNGNLGDSWNFPYNLLPNMNTGYYQPSQNLVNAFKTRNGLPYLAFFGLDYNANDVTNDMGIESYAPFTPDGQPLDPRLDWTVGRRDIPYLDWGPHPGKDWIKDQTWAGPYSPKKNVIYEAEMWSGSFTGWGVIATANNYSILRYADVLLLAAECEVEVGSLERARELVNMVRERAARTETWILNVEGSGPAANYQISIYPTGEALDPFQSQEGAREAVRFERRLELGMEGHRFWDLKRWGTAKEVLNQYIASEGRITKDIRGAVFQDEDIRHPVPFNEIQLSHGTLKQNPGYF